MTDPDFRLSSYEYPLPPALVAQEPLPERDQSRLLVLDRRTGAVQHREFAELPDLLRPGDLLVVSSDHGCDPTTPSTDHSREHALLLAYAAGRNASGRVHEEGEFADVGATVSSWLGGKSSGRKLPGRVIEL